MHNLQLDDDQTLILDTVKKFVQDSVAPHALARDEHREFDRAGFDGMAELGLFGLPVAEAAGGAALGFLPLAAAAEEIGGQSGSLARLLSVQVACALALEAKPGPELEGLLQGSAVGAFVGPEHGIAIDHGKLVGTAELVTGAGEAGLLVCAAQQAGATVLCVLDSASAGRTPLRSLGLASAAPTRVELTGVDATIVLTGADAERAIERAQFVLWLGGASASVGSGAMSCAMSRKYAGDRLAFGKPLLAQQAVVRKLVESRRAVDAARHLAFHAARLADRGSAATDSVLQARIAAVDAAVHAADEGIQVHGGFGYTVEYHVERHYRDAKTLEVLDGGNDRLKDRLGRIQFAT
jgi:alkylation response protein AidB-like acyl-CoA dehydrogenase